MVSEPLTQRAVFQSSTTILPRIQGPPCGRKLHPRIKFLNISWVYFSLLCDLIGKSSINLFTNHVIFTNLYLVVANVSLT